MKRIYTLLTIALVSTIVFAQSPQKMNYQAVIRNSSDQLVSAQAVGMRISILQGSSSGTVVYSEVQTPTTNANGLISIEIGGGEGFDTINWANGILFIKTETDPSGGENYTITGTSQILSVPYALHSETAQNLSGGINETDPLFTEWDKSTGIIVNASQVSDFQSSVSSIPDVVTTTANQSITGNKTFTGTTSVVTPVNDSDAANKAYVDSKTAFSISSVGDTLYLGDGEFIIVPGLSESNSGVGKTTEVPDIVWSLSNVDASDNPVHVAFGNNTFVAVTDNGCVTTNNSAYVSSDFGINWVKKATPGSTNMSGVAYSPENQYFVASHRCYEFQRNYSYSIDNGNTWTPLMHSPNTYRYDLYRVKDYFFSCIVENTCDRSIDGVNWTHLTFAGTKTTSVATYSEKFGLYYGNTYPVYAEVNEPFWTSPDGSNWTARDTLGRYQFVAGNDVVLAFVNSSPDCILRKSDDGINFNIINTLPEISSIQHMKFIDGLFWATIADSGDDSKKVMVSNDGTDWKILTTPSTSSTAFDIAIGYDSILNKNTVIISCSGGVFLKGDYTRISELE